MAKKVLKDNMAVASATWVLAFSIMHLWHSQEAPILCVGFISGLGEHICIVAVLGKAVGGAVVTIVLAVAASLYTHNMVFSYGSALCLDNGRVAAPG